MRLRYTTTENSKKIFSVISTIYPETQIALYSGLIPNSTDDKVVVLSYEVAQKMGFEEPKDLLSKEVEMVFANEINSENNLK